eukprot:Seg6037.1 transcript_id=Seg6037.1/GoldUCD/mRNA.D3Y31 product="SURP and G-patch domain-containing protein 1" protein_id=Seg6037.1/GoldUCD/D3Y31
MSNYLQEQKRLIDERKRQVLERVASKKTEGNAREPSAIMSTTIGPTNGPNTTGANLLANDGNFLARFQAMQKEAQAKKNAEGKDSSSGKLKINLGGVKKKEFKPVTSTFPRPTAFENPEPSSNSEEVLTLETDVLKAAEELAMKVAKEGDEVEALARMKHQKDSKYRFLFDESHPAFIKYKELLKGFKAKNESTQQPTVVRRKRRNRWDEVSEEASSSTATQSSSSNPPDIMEEFQRAKALILQRAAEAKAKGGLMTVDVERQKQIETQKEIEAMYRRIIAEEAIKAQTQARNNQDKPKYEYDSDEDCDDGTWEHKKRKLEMEKTLNESIAATERAKGKHHMGDFLPPEELARFQEKVKAIKEGRQADLSDYSEFKIKEDNIGYKLLQQAGWQEGKGLGAEGKGITQPINKGVTSFDNSGVGVEKPHEVEKEDDEFDVYRKRMMLAYKFRPNPLNNPRRPYY